jgi:hypothetical protein
MHYLIILILLCVSLAPRTDAQAATCSPSTPSKATTIKFVNYTERPIVIFWVNFDCTERSYSVLKKGLFYSQPTYVGHIWRMRDQETNVLVGELTANDAITFPIGTFTLPSADIPCTPTGQNEAITLRFTNYTSRQLSLYWIDTNCKERLYSTIKPGAYYDQPTYVGHSWFVRDDTHKITLTGFITQNSRTARVPIGAQAVMPANVCSRNDAQAIDRTIVNYTSRRVDIVAVDSTCQEKLYKTLKGGQSIIVSTFVGSVWHMYDHDTKLLIDEMIIAE